MITYEPYVTCTIPDLLRSIWAFAKDNQLKDSIMESLYNQMKDGLNYCFVGKYSRVVYAVIPFMDEKVELPFVDRFNNEMDRLKKLKYTNEQLVEAMTDFINTSEVPQKEKDVWLDGVKDYLE